MTYLSDEDLAAITDAVMDDRDRSNGYVVLGPGGTDGNTPTLAEAVESLIVRHRAAALREAAGRLEKERKECNAPNEGTCHEADQIRLGWIADQIEGEKR